jgi:hypothetical protein
MELELMKQQIRKRLEHRVIEETVDISAIIRKKSTDVSGHLLGSLRFEIITGVFFILVALGVVLGTSSGYLQLMSAVVLIYTGIFLVFLVRLQRSVKEYFRENKPTVVAVKSILRIMNRFRALYFRLCMLFIPVFFLITLLFFVQDHPSFLNSPELFLSSKPFLLFLLGFFCWEVILYFFTRWYLNSLYGRYLIELQDLLNELKVA